MGNCIKKKKNIRVFIKSASIPNNSEDEKVLDTNYLFVNTGIFSQQKKTNKNHERKLRVLKLKDAVINL